MSYAKIDLTSNIVLSWTYPFTGGTVVADINDIIPNDNGWTITLPDATLVPVGQSILFNNRSPFGFILLNGQDILYAFQAGNIVQIYLIDSSLPRGIWGFIPYGAGMSGITSLTATSSSNPDGGLTITGNPANPVVSPGGTLNFKLNAALENILNINSNGFVAIVEQAPLTWEARELTDGNNITITNPDGVAGNPIVDLNTSLNGLTSVGVGDFTITGSSISTAQTTGTINLNGIGIDVNNNISGINTLTAANIASLAIARAWCFFLDNGNLTNNITVQSSYNVSSVTGSNGSYIINFTTPFNDASYAPLITLSRGTETIAPFQAFPQLRTAGYIMVYTVDTLGNLLPATDGLSVAIFANQ